MLGDHLDLIWIWIDYKYFNAMQILLPFLPVEHRSYNRDFKISSKILSRPHPTPKTHFEVFCQFFFTGVWRQAISKTG